MPSSTKAKRCLLKHLPVGLEGTIYDLGSGWGSLAFPLAHIYRDCKIVGLETSTIPYWFSRIRHIFQPAINLHLLRRDIFSVSLGEASLIICYLYPAAMQKLKAKFEQELKPGTWIISNTFSISGWNPEAIYEVGDMYHNKIYVYRIPIK